MNKRAITLQSSRQSAVRSLQCLFLGLAGALCLTAAVRFAGAQEAATPNDTPVEEKAADMLRLLPRIGIQGEMVVSLPDVIRMSLENNKDIESSRIDRRIAQFALKKGLSG